MQHDQAHAADDRVAHPLGRLLRQLGVRAMAPPQHDVGVVEPRQAVARVVERRRRHLGVRQVGAQARRERTVQAVRVDGRDALVVALRAVLVPDQDAHQRSTRSMMTGQPSSSAASRSRFSR